jgi:hypothetical protein
VTKPQQCGFFFARDKSAAFNSLVSSNAYSMRYKHLGLMPE